MYSRITSLSPLYTIFMALFLQDFLLFAYFNEARAAGVVIQISDSVSRDCSSLLWEATSLTSPLDRGEGLVKRRGRREIEAANDRLMHCGVQAIWVPDTLLQLVQIYHHFDHPAPGKETKMTEIQRALKPGALFERVSHGRWNGYSESSPGL